MTINLGCSTNFFLHQYTTYFSHGKRYGSQINILISICHLEHFWYLFLTLWNNRIWLEALNNMDHSPTKQGPSLYHLKVKLVQRPQLLQFGLKTGYTLLWQKCSSSKTTEIKWSRNLNGFSFWDWLHCKYRTNE